MSDKNHSLDDRLLDLLYDELEPGEAAQLRRELTADPALETRLHGWASIRAMAAELEEEEPDPQVHYSILRGARAAASQEAKPGWFSWVQWLTASPALAAVGLMIFAGSLYTLMSGNLTEGNPDSTMSSVQIQPAEMLEKSVDREAEGTLAMPSTPRATRPSAAGKGDAIQRRANSAAEPSDELIIRPSRSEFEFLKKPEGKAVKASPIGGLAEGTPDQRKDSSGTKNRRVRRSKKGLSKQKRGYGRSQKRSKKFRPDGPPKKRRARAKASKGKAKTSSREARPVEGLLTNKPVKEQKRIGSVQRPEFDDAVQVPAVQSEREPAPVQFAPAPAPAPEAPSAQEFGSKGLQDSAPRKRPEIQKRKGLIARTAKRDVDTFMAGDDDGSQAVEGASSMVVGEAAARLDAGARRGSQAKASGGRASVRNVQKNSSRLLVVARQAKTRGDHRRAVQAYEAFMTAVGSLSDRRGNGADYQRLVRVWYEAALSYQSLGNHSRARVLLRRVAASRSPYASRARKSLASTRRKLSKKAKSGVSDEKSVAPSQPGAKPAGVPTGKPSRR